MAFGIFTVPIRAPVSILSVEIVTAIYVNLSRNVCTSDSKLNQGMALA